MERSRASEAEAGVSLRSLAQRSVVYALGGLAYKGLALLTVPLLARLLQPAELGLLDVAAVVASVLGLVAGLGSEQAIAWLEPQVSRQGTLWASALVMVTAVASALVVLVVAFAEPLATLMTGSPANSGLMVAAAVYAVVIALTAAALNATRLRAAPYQYALASFAVVVTEVCTGLVIAWRVASPVTPMIVGWTLASGLVTAAILLRVLPPLSVPDSRTVRKLVRFGLPLVPAAVAWMLGDAVVRSSLARTGDLSALGGYGIAYRISTGLGIFVVGFGVAWQPYLYRSEASSVQDRARRIAPLVMAAIGAAAVVITALANEIVHLVAGDRYVAAIVAVPALTGGMVALALFTLLSTVSGVLYGTGRVGLLAIVGTAVQAGLALVLVPAFGLTGAALASALGYGVSAVLLAVSVRFVRLDRSGIALIVVSALVVGGLVVGQSIGSADLLIRASLAGAVTCVAALALWRSSSGLAGRDD